jgi:hypothetical protein
VGLRRKESEEHTRPSGSVWVMKSLSGFVGGGAAGWGKASSAIVGLMPSNPASANPHNNMRIISSLGASAELHCAFR